MTLIIFYDDTALATPHFVIFSILMLNSLSWIEIFSALYSQKLSVFALPLFKPPVKVHFSLYIFS